MLRDALKIGSKRPLLNLPTGAGKTVIASEIVKSALSKKKRVIFTVPFISLVDQTVERFWEHGIRNIGVIQSNHPMTAPDRPVQIASIQTLARRTIPKADLVLIDECHLNFKRIAQWMEDWSDVPFIGLSATPGTRGLGRLYDKLICPIGMNELIDKGFLSKYRAFAPSHPDLSQVKTVAGDYHEGQLSDVMKKLTGDVVQTWIERGIPDKTLVFAVDRAHAKHLQERFEAHGIRAGYVDALTTMADREALKNHSIGVTPRLFAAWEQ